MLREPPFVPDVEMLDNYLAGQLSLADAERVRQWAASHDVRGVLVETLQVYARGGSVLERPVDVERGERLLREYGVHGLVHRGGMRRLIGKSLRGGSFKSQPLPRRGCTTQPRRSGWRPFAVALSAGVAVTVTGWIAGMRYLSQREAASNLTYTTGNGQRANITLPDGSTVALNVASRLDVPADYAAGHHTVRLAGEALFTVVHHDGQPVTVVTGSAKVCVLGTSFVVREYATDSTATVAVRSGKVMVQSVVLSATQQAEFGKTGVVHVRPADLSQFSFASGVLTLKAVPLRDAIVALDRWYNADIRLASPALGQRQIMGEFTAGSLSDLVTTLEVTFNVRVVRDGRVLTIYPR